MDIKVEEIGPDRAKELLGTTRNRNVRQRHVAGLARDMDAGRWGAHSVLMVADTPDGDVLIDGQHRLHAIVRSGITAEFVVMYGLAMEDQQNIDTGIARRLSDTLQLRGEKSVTVLAAAIGYLWRKQRGIYNGNNHAPTRAEGLLVLEENPGLRDSITPTNRASTTLRYPHGLATFLHYEMCAIDAEGAADFWEKLATGLGLHERHPVYLLRARLEASALSNPRKLDPSQTHALTIKAWNAYMRGDDVGVLKFTRGGPTPEAFPVLGDGQP